MNIDQSYLRLATFAFIVNIPDQAMILYYYSREEREREGEEGERKGERGKKEERGREKGERGRE